MKNLKKKILFFTGIFIISLFTSATLSKAGYGSDTSGDSDVADVDIIRLDVSITELKITLVKTPQVNSSEHILYTYNIFVDSSDSDTPSYSEDVWEYCAHFKWYYSNNSWLNESYFYASRYWITEDYEKQNGAWWWNKLTKKWVNSDPRQDIAVVNGNTISFDITDAIEYEAPAGYNAFSWLKAFANGGVDLKVNDTAPNYGWIREIDPVVYPGKKTTSEQTSAFNLELILFALVIISSISLFSHKHQNKNK